VTISPPKFPDRLPCKGKIFLSPWKYFLPVNFFWKKIYPFFFTYFHVWRTELFTLINRKEGNKNGCNCYDQQFWSHSFHFITIHDIFFHRNWLKPGKKNKSIHNSRKCEFVTISCYLVKRSGRKCNRMLSKVASTNVFHPKKFLEIFSKICYYICLKMEIRMKGCLKLLMFFFRPALFWTGC
jgi:hypothetical protein